MKIPLAKNTLTNYLNLTVRLVQGILITRWLIAGLGEERYGFWGLLWSFFCYSLLLDFGLGVTVQKSTAEELWRRDMDKYNRLVSSIFTVNMLMSLLIIFGTFIASVFIRRLLHLEGAAAENPAYYRQCLMVCGIGSALVFSLGAFGEILAGLQKIYLRNYAAAAGKVAELFVVLAVFAAGGGLLTLLAASLALMTAVQLVNAYFVCRAIPGFRLRLQLDRGILKETFHFSKAVYILSLARLVWDRGAVLLITFFSGLLPVSVYLVGSRFPVLLTQLTQPYQENISPLSALLHSRRKRRKLAGIVVNSMRWNSLLATGLAAGIFIYARVIIRFLLGVDSADGAYICRIMTVLVYVQTVFRALPEKYLLMTGEHKFVSRIFMAESLIFAVGSATLLSICKIDGTVAVSYCALITKVLCTAVLVMPRFMKHSGLSLGQILYAVLWRELPSALAVSLLGVWEYRSLETGDFGLLLTAGFTCGALYLVTALFWGMDRREWRNIPVISKIGGRL